MLGTAGTAKAFVKSFLDPLAANEVGGLSRLELEVLVFPKNGWAKFLGVVERMARWCSFSASKMSLTQPAGIFGSSPTEAAAMIEHFLEEVEEKQPREGDEKRFADVQMKSFLERHGFVSVYSARQANCQKVQMETWPARVQSCAIIFLEVVKSLDTLGSSLWGWHVGHVRKLSLRQ